MKKQTKDNWMVCRCGCKAIRIQAEIIELEDKNKTLIKEMYFSIYNYGVNGHKPNFKDKMKGIWQIIKNGTAYADEVCLQFEDIKVLRDLCAEAITTSIKKSEV